MNQNVSVSSSNPRKIQRTGASTQSATTPKTILTGSLTIIDYGYSTLHLPNRKLKRHRRRIPKRQRQKQPPLEERQPPKLLSRNNNSSRARDPHHPRRTPPISALVQATLHLQHPPMVTRLAEEREAQGGRVSGCKRTKSSSISLQSYRTLINRLAMHHTPSPNRPPTMNLSCQIPPKALSMLMTLQWTLIRMMPHSSSKTSTKKRSRSPPKRTPQIRMRRHGSNMKPLQSPNPSGRPPVSCLPSRNILTRKHCTSSSETTLHLGF